VDRNGRWLPWTLIWEISCEPPARSGSSREESARCLIQLCQSGKGLTAMFCLAEAAGKPLRQAPRSTVVSRPGGPGPTRLKEAMREAWPGNYTHERTSLDLSNRALLHSVFQTVSHACPFFAAYVYSNSSTLGVPSRNSINKVFTTSTPVSSV
jgi:hypothetical protein